MLENLITKTKEVFSDCLLPNGCLAAAPSHMPYYPKTAKNYLYCWPGRDLGFGITAAEHLGIDISEKVLSWIWERAENYQTAQSKWKEGLLARSYYPNGRIRETSFQPDQTGTLLWAVQKIKPSPLTKKIIKKSAGGLIRAWDNDHFKLSAEDLWEERIAHPRFKNNLTYSLAACIAGLKKVSDPQARKTTKQMEALIKEKAFDSQAGYFLRRFGGTVAADKNIDASLLGLVWPFEIIKADDPRMIKTIAAIEENITDEKGVYRYQFDEYEGEVEKGDLHYRMGAGAWPVLTFWMSIVQNKMGNRKKAEKYFRLVLDQLGKDFLIPEQFFPAGDPRIGVKPLLWSHAMFVHAAVELGYIK
ncbi:MAG: glycoside hydrolase family 15 protein [bacterium]